METERPKEDEWFARNEKEMLEKARVARAKREHERAESEALEERQRAKQLHFMKCPKCGHDLAQCDLGVCAAGRLRHEMGRQPTT